ncbi:aminoacetone oxidase family FAD-binding enzyme [bacterium]|nr:aminoacetone oxidase family FAD-binding enzyme [bacterium]
MVHEFKNIAIIGAGASGCMCAYFLLNNTNNIISHNLNQPIIEKENLSITLFDKGAPLRTLLPTGGGRCNLAHAEYDFKELVKSYPRGEKFLYSIFSKYSTLNTIETFKKMGIETYAQENGRIFPKSNSAKIVRENILKNIQKANFVKEEVTEIVQLNPGFKIITNKAQYLFDIVILAIGGHSGLKLVNNLGIKTVEQRPSLVGLNTKEDFKTLSGTVVKNVTYNNIYEDLLFTHFGVSGPLVYTISSIKAFKKTPYILNFDLAPDLKDLQEILDNNPHKEIKNILNKYLPAKLINYILNDIDETTKAHKINGKTRDLILNKIHNFEINIIGTNKGDETVTAGGIDLNEINPKTMGIKNFSGLYAIGEILNIDGFCGGYNLQNAWSTSYICANSIF